MHMFFLRHIIKWDYDKYPKNTPTLKFFYPARAKDVDFERERREVIQRLKMVNNYNQKFIINSIYGKLTKETYKEVEGETPLFI